MQLALRELHCVLDGHRAGREVELRGLRDPGAKGGAHHALKPRRLGRQELVGDDEEATVGAARTTGLGFACMPAAIAPELRPRVA